MQKVVEIAKFKSKDGVSVEDLLKASEEMEKNFAIKQKGFISRTMAQGEDNTWVDILFWENWDLAQEAMKVAMESPACMPFFELINQESIEMSHYKISN